MGKKEEKQVRLNITGLANLLMDALMGGWMDGSMYGWLNRQTERGRRASRHADGEKDREVDVISNCYWSIVYNNLNTDILHTSRETTFHSLNCHRHFKFQSHHSDNHNLKFTHSPNN